MFKICVGIDQILIADVGYLDNDSYDVLQPTAWIPFLDTNEVNGCMQVLYILRLHLSLIFKPMLWMLYLENDMVKG